MGRRKVREPKKRTLCLRLTEKQFEILQLYTDIKGFDTEVDALRHIVDGLATWMKKQDADMEDEPTAAPSSSAPPAPSAPAVARPAMDGSPGVM